MSTDENTTVRGRSTIDAFADWVEAGWTRGDANDDRELAIMALGLVGEAGEVTELLKKQLRGDGPANLEKLTLELGDVLHYWCRLARRFHLDPQDIMAANIEKIEARRGKRAFEVKAS